MTAISLQLLGDMRMRLLRALWARLRDRLALIWVRLARWIKGDKPRG